MSFRTDVFSRKELAGIIAVSVAVALILGIAYMNRI